MTKKINSDNSKQIMNLKIKNGELPQYVYKYTDITSLKLILMNSTLQFSKPSDFNDPFDCNITIDTNNSTEEIDEYIKMVSQSNNLQDKQIRVIKKKYHNPKELHEITNKSIKETKETIGVTCFSMSFDNLLMWSHYSDKHKGVCLKFDLSADKEFFMTPFIVEYNINYPTFNYIRDEGLAQFLLTTKYIDWQYENEIRVMKDSNGQFSFNRNSLVEIIFGVKSSDAEIVKIQDLIKKLNYNQTVFRKAKVSETDFKLIIE